MYVGADLYAHMWVHKLQADLVLLSLLVLKKETTRLWTLGRDWSLWPVTGRGGGLSRETGVGGCSMTCGEAMSPFLALPRAGALMRNSGPSGDFLLVC